jgi:hypothetical protein
VILSLRKKAVAALLAVGTGGGLAATLPASPAVAYFSPPLFLDVVVESPGRLIAGGAGVQVPVEVTCNAGVVAEVDIRVTQNVNGRLAEGVGFAIVGCTGMHQQVLLTAVASGNRAFATGRALAAASVFGCTTGVCGFERDQRTIRLRR